ncbi:alpha/beta fold hydrolase [Kitasatospora sp. NPDC049258]|uniref:alpha/beta fold hydrolase n=1 Tax=Kitasatospora sp. NPDC049258 TaxID=3155394 RepID=UPI003444C649
MSVDDFFQAYDTLRARWPHGTTTVDLRSAFGTTRVLACGPEGAPPLVLLPGGGAGATAWLALAAELGDRHRLYAVDRIGEPGRSVADGRTPATPADLLEWLGTVLDGLGLGRTHLCGHSYGAWIALTYALHAPARVNRLALLDPTQCFAGFRPGYLLHALPMLLRPTEARARAFLDWECAGLAVDEGWQRQYALGVADFPSAKVVVGRRPRAAALRDCAAPTLVLLAGRGRAHRPRAVRRGARLLPDVRVELLEGASHHSLPMAGAGEVGGRLSAFLADRGPAAQAALGSSL